MERRPGFFGLPMRCPRCVGKDAYAWLKLPGVVPPPCPNCGGHLEPYLSRKKRQMARRNAIRSAHDDLDRRD